MPNKRSSRPFLVGVTGGIGSGKSTVCRILEEQGFPVLKADDIAREIQESDARVRRNIRALIGPEAYRDGRLDRAVVAERIFGNPSLRRKLERIVHPVVESEILKRAGKLGREGARAVVIEAALIFEAGLDTVLDFIVVVDADEGVRLRRVQERDGTDPGSIRRRMASQLPPSRTAAAADFVVRNNEGPDELRQRVGLLITLLSVLSTRRKHANPV